MTHENGARLVGVVRNGALYEVKRGDGVRVTLSEGELRCEVVKTDGLDN